MRKSTHTFKVLSSLTLATLLTACGSDNDNDNNDEPETADFEVTIVNATAAQPFSPLTIGLHDAETSLWTFGEESSEALEQMAEGGDNSGLLAMLEGAHASASGAGIIMPGLSETVMLSSEVDEPIYFSATTMLVNTNDAFAGVNSADISALAAGESMTWSLHLYDAGTEANSELAGSIPGPADSGEGFNANRDDVMNKISRHPGLVTQADDPDSVLLSQHRVIGSVATLTVTRMN
ncbi:spondin domain-containing protein [Echinimonas agarilytica]|uniref:Spondin domain-containing protein n=1 Tax=Echinimonas agarilytica TaxID=1215918 RepID=A0AA42B833_9GAMM|nr:spondin domain-containing protein [Echinimonas agarilytica]MCM2679886.1 spondin domain-containing protein [Echinimonas agarilytica]